MRMWTAVVAAGLASGCGGSTPDTTDADPTDSTPTAVDTDPGTDTLLTDTSTTDTTTTDSTTTDEDGLHGEVPAVALPLPSFSEVIAMSGTAASPDDLVGQPTVLWFYPAAFTGG